MSLPAHSAQPALHILRKMLGALLPTDADFDAFCIDQFRDEHRRFSAGMDRLSKTNLLLQRIEPDELLLSLNQAFSHSPKKLDLISRFLNDMDSEEKQKAAGLALKLRHLSIERHKRRLTSQDTADIDAQMVAIKREQRQFSQLQPGEVLSDRYELLEIVGKGGFARIWQAYDQVSERLVAIKILHAEASDEPRRVERFVRGAKQMKDLNHPNIVRVLDGPAEHRGFHYFVMDYFSGSDLARAMISGAIGRLQALNILRDIGAALTYAHANRVIHRDVKPENIVLDGQGKAYLTDFDLVWAAGTTGGTRTGFLGTYMYVPPEQAEDAKSVDERADVYALGMTALFVLYRKPLPHRAIRQRALFIDALDCEESLKALLRQTTADDPDDRPPSIAAFCRELVRILEPQLTAVHLEPPAPSSQSKPKDDIRDKVVHQDGGRSPRMTILIGVLLLAVVVGGVFWFINRQSATSAEDQAPKILLDVESDLQAKRWADAIDKTSRILSNPSVSSKVKDVAQSKKFRAEQEAKAKQIYERFSTAAGSGNYDQALTAYREIPDESVYRQIAHEQYDQSFPLFVENKLKAAEEARGQGRCSEFQSHIQAVLSLDPKHPKALAAKERPCGEKGSSASVENLPSANPSRPERVRKPREPAPIENTADVDTKLSEAQTEYVNGNYSKAIEMAKSVQKGSPVRAWRIIGSAACNIKDLKLVTDAFRRLDAPGRQYLVFVCQRNGIQNIGNQFKLSE